MIIYAMPHELLDLGSGILSKQSVKVHISKSSSDGIRNSHMARLHPIQKFTYLAPDTLFLAAHARNRQESLGTGVLGGQILGHINEWPDQPHSAFL